MRSNYTKLVWCITEDLKKILSKPLGEVYSTDQYLRLLQTKNLYQVVTVGDVVSSVAISNGYKPRIAIVDQKTKRSGFDFNWARFKPVAVWNPPGTISLESVVKFVELLERNENSVLLVEGEEDMLALLAVLVSPLGYTVFYGQPDLGVVCVEIDKAKRLEALNIFGKMVLRVYE